MNIIRALYSVVIDALFPLSEAELFLRQLSPETAGAALTPAPPYDASVVPMPGTASLFAYKDERVSKLVWSIKYKKDSHALRIGGFALGRRLQELRAQSPNSRIVIVPIPISERRRRERGYNQCELLAGEIAQLDTGHEFIHEPGLLMRVRHKNRQTMKGRAERLESSAGIFAVNPATAEKIKLAYGTGMRLVVIDDVITTGSTMKTALDALSSAGFENVRGLSLAH